MSYQRIHVVINPAAGAAEPILHILNTVFRKHDVQWTVSVTNGPGDGARQAAAAAESGVDVVAAYGGDGTLMEVASGLVNTQTPLAYLPGGTGNVMAAELHIPRRLDSAAELIVNPQSELRPLDVGQIDGHHFLMRASVGFEARVVERTSRELKDRFGLLAYGMSVLQTLAEPLTAHYRLTLDGHELETEGASLLIANAGSLGRLNLHLGPIITPDDGLLDVMLIGHDTDIVLSMAATLVQLDELTASVQHWQAREVHIEADPVQNTQVDGDVLGQTPATATVLPGAVRILTPQGSATRPR